MQPCAAIRLPQNLKCEKVFSFILVNVVIDLQMQMFSTRPSRRQLAGPNELAPLPLALLFSVTVTKNCFSFPLTMPTLILSLSVSLIGAIAFQARTKFLAYL